MNNSELNLDPWAGPGFEDNEPQPLVVPYIGLFDWHLHPVIDWISFTLLDASHVSDFFKIFKILDVEFTAAPRGRLGYLSMLVHRQYSGFQILHEGRKGMGVHVDISGEAVPYFLSIFSSPADCFKVLVSENANITRLDLAIDDVGAMYFTTTEVLRLIEARQIVSRSKKYSSTVKKTMQGDWRGHTIYIGSRTSEAMLRVYDKAAETLSDSADAYSFKLAWTRWELELKGGKALDAVKYLGEVGPSFGRVCFATLSSFMRLIELDCTRRERCSTLPLWNEFLCGVNRLTYTPKIKTTLDQTRAWLMKSASKSFAKVVMADGDLEFIHDLLRVGYERLEKEDYDQVARHEAAMDRAYLMTYGESVDV